MGGNSISIQDTGFRFASGVVWTCLGGAEAVGQSFISEYISSVACTGTCGVPRMYVPLNGQQITHIPILMEHF